MLNTWMINANTLGALRSGYSSGYMEDLPSFLACLLQGHPLLAAVCCFAEQLDNIPCGGGIGEQPVTGWHWLIPVWFTFMP